MARRRSRGRAASPGPPRQLPGSLQGRKRQRAKQFLAGAGQARIALYRETQVRMYKTLSAAFIGDFLAIGRLENVHAALDARAGHALEEDGVFRDARAGLDLSGPLLFGYAPCATACAAASAAEGDRRPPGRRARAAGRFAGPRRRSASRPGACASRSPTSNTSGCRAPTACPPHPAAHPVGARRRDRLLRGAGREPALPTASGGLRRQGVGAHQHDRAAAAAASTERRAGARPRPPAARPPGGRADRHTSRRFAGHLPDRGRHDDVGGRRRPDRPAAAPLARWCARPAGAAATLVPGSEAGLDTITLRLSPDLSLTYASSGDRIMVSTDPDGVRQVAQAEKTLQGASAFAPGMRDLLREATSVVSRSAPALDSLIERAGLGANAGIPNESGRDLRESGTVSVITQTDRSSQTAQAFIEVP